MKKTCSKCGKEQPIEEFYKSARYKDGREGRCRTCKKEAMDDYLERNPLCSHCKKRPRQPTNAICYECQREMRGDTEPPKFRRDSYNKDMCSRCKVRPRQKNHNYCRECQREVNKEWIKGRGGIWHYMTSLGKRCVKLAHAAVYKAVQSGKLIKPNRCELCGKEAPLEGHHYRGYEKEFWLVVQWLCALCHDKIHKKEFDSEKE